MPDKGVWVVRGREEVSIDTFWHRYGPILMSVGFAFIVLVLKLRQHAALNTRVYDFARFAQALWTTLNGKFLFSSLHYGSILGNHFSPLMALWSPLIVLWTDERVLFLIQAVNVALTGLILHQTFRVLVPRFAVWFLLIFYLNPALHQVALFEVRRVVFGMPFLALALYGLVTRQRWTMLVGVSVALLAKESLALYVVMMGLYLLVVEREWAWGTGLLVLGAVWLTAVSLWVIPAIRASGGTLGTYPQLYYFSHLGESYSSILKTLLRSPLALLAELPLLDEVLALVRLLLPFGFFLPLLAPKFAFLCVPYIGLMFLSSDVDMIRLDKWYPTTILPVLFVATALGWDRLPVRWYKRVVVGWLAATLVGYALFSTAPLGGRYEPERYRVTDRDRLAGRVVASVPPDVAVAANHEYVPHLVERMEVYHYPILPTGEESIDMFLFDRKADVYLISQEKLNARIDEWVEDPNVFIDAEADGIYLFRTFGEPPPAYDIHRVALGTMRLDRVEVAVRDATTPYRVVNSSEITLAQGQHIQVRLYWEALGVPEEDLKVSVRISGADAVPFAQHDQVPGAGRRPTNGWEPGLAFRDIYAMTVPLDAPIGPASLDLVLYRDGSLAPVSFDGIDSGNGILPIVPVRIEPGDS